MVGACGRSINEMIFCKFCSRYANSSGFGKARKRKATTLSRIIATLPLVLNLRGFQFLPQPFENFPGPSLCAPAFPPESLTIIIFHQPELRLFWDLLGFLQPTAIYGDGKPPHGMPHGMARGALGARAVQSTASLTAHLGGGDPAIIKALWSTA